MKMLDRFVVAFSWISAVILVGVVCTIFGHIILNGAGTIKPSLIFGDVAPLDALLLKRQVLNGLFPAIIGTLLLVIISVMWAVPLGLGTGIYLSEYAGAIQKKIFNLFFDILAGIPSIVIGLFGFALAIFLHKNVSNNIGPCLLISSMALAFLVLPYIIRTTQVALEELPREMRLTALALGATRLQNIRHVLLPRALSGITTGVILAIGRCAEDTAVILLTGVVAMAGIPHSLMGSYEALPFYIYYISSQYTSPEELLTGYGASLILLVLCLGLFSTAFVIQKRLTYVTLYRA